MAGGRGITVTLLLVLLVAATNSTRFIVENRCNYSVWLGTIPAMGLQMFEVDPDQVMYINADDGWRGRIWFRTHCTTDDNGIFSCLTGDCGSTYQSCEGKKTKEPVTLVDFLNFSGDRSLYFYDVNLLHGFNVPVMVFPQGGPAPCNSTGCPTDVNKICYPGLTVTDHDGAAIGCRSDCDALLDEKLCCLGEYGSPEKCHPSKYTLGVKEACPLAHTWIYDGGVNKCSGSDFNMTLCP